MRGRLVKAVAAGAVLVGAALPVALSGGAAGAAATTGPTLYCSQTAPTTSPMYNYQGSVYCASMPYGTQNSQLTINLSGANLAFDQGNVSATTNATGVTVEGVVENNQNSATVYLGIGASTAPGYYSITLTDHNGTATLQNAFGVDPAATITSYTPKTMSEGATTLITVSGSGLTSGIVSVDGNIPGFSVTSGVASPDGTSLTFYATASATLALGTYPVAISGVNTTDANGNPGIDITVTGASISSISPSQFGHNATPTTVTQNMTITGSGFQPGAVVRVGGNLLPWQPFQSTGTSDSTPEVTFGTATVVNATTITVPVTIQTDFGAGTLNNTTASQWDVSVTNPDGTNYTATGAIGWLEAGNSAYTTPQVTMVYDALTPGVGTVYLSGNAAFGLVPGDSVTLSYGPFSFPGAITGFGSGGYANDLMAQVYLPQYLSTTLTQPATAGQTNIVVASLAGISAQNLTFVDATGETIAANNEQPVTSSVNLAGQLKFSHAAGTVVEFPIQSVTSWTLAVNNGSTTLNIAGLTVGATPLQSISYMRTDGTSPNGTTALLPGGTETWPVSTMHLAPGTYTMLVDFPGANFATGGASIAFATAGGTNPDGITGTITPTNTDTAYVTITMPATVATPTYTNSGDTVGATAPVGSSSITVSSASGLSVGEQIALDYGTTSQETVTIASISGTTVNLTGKTVFAHATGATIYGVSYANTSSGTTYNAIVNTGNGQLLTESGFAATEASKVGPITGFGFTSSGAAAAPGLIVGAGASSAEVFIYGTYSGSASALDYMVTSTTPGVTFGAVMTVTSGYLGVLMSVAAGTPVNTSVQVTVTEIDGNGTASVPTSANPNSGLLIGNTPTITGITGLPASLIPGETATFSITGTLFDNTTLTSVTFLADSGNLQGMPDTGSVLGNGYGTYDSYAGYSYPYGQGGITVSGCALNSSTSITCSVTVAGGATNGAHDLLITNSSDGSAVLANALTVANATIGSVSPATYQSDMSTDTFTLSNLAGFADVQAAQGGPTPTAYATTFFPDGTEADTSGPLTTTWAGANAVTVQVPGSLQRPAGGYLVITLEQASTVTGTALSIDATAIPLGLPLVVGAGPVFAQPAGTSGSFAIAAGAAQDNDGVGGTDFDPPFDVATTFMPGATVSVVSPNPAYVPANPGITVSGVTVLPGLITGSIAVGSSVPSGTYDLVVTNPDGGVVYTTIVVTANPQVQSVDTVPVLTGPVSFLNGTSTTLNIAGSNFQTGIVVSASVPGDASFGTATVNSAGTFLTVPVQFTTLTGGVPAVIDLVLTNPDGGTSAVAGELVINPSPTVVGTYYVPTFTSNTEVVINGTGFQSGLTVSSSNAAYAVSVANVTPTTLTLLVSTTAEATTGTSSNVTVTNPDGGTVTFALNGGPNPATEPQAPHAVRTVGPVWTGKVSTVRVTGTGFFGQPKVTSNVPGVKVGVSHDTGRILTLVVHTPKTARRGVHTFTITFSNGATTTVKYNQR
ncbi:MAG: beta strand repeat-containing protein [Acidimicrobiales bacterium]